jgi:hypothetical protein
VIFVPVCFEEVRAILREFDNSRNLVLSVDFSGVFIGGELGAWADRLFLAYREILKI